MVVFFVLCYGGFGLVFGCVLIYMNCGVDWLIEFVEDLDEDVLVVFVGCVLDGDLLIEGGLCEFGLVVVVC